MLVVRPQKAAQQNTARTIPWRWRHRWYGWELV